jgi:hypothetical protein
MIEKILWYLFLIDSIGYTVLTVFSFKHKKKSHYFFKIIPLHWAIALLYLFLVAWVGYSLYRLDVLF